MTVLQSINENVVANLDSIVENTGSQNLFQTVTAESNGIVVYAVDGYEQINDNNVTTNDFNKDNYNKNNLKGESLIVSGNPAYKIVTSEDWYMLIRLSKDDIDEYGLASKKSLNIKIKKDNMTVKCGFSIIEKSDGYYGKLSLDSYMIRYAQERFLDIELVTTGKSGMKIPVSAVTENEFYEIPRSYLTKGGNSSNQGFICEKYDNGNLITTFVEATKKLKGVYCVNTGYTIFCPVEIIDENNEYYIVKQNLTHGISVYDRIILDALKYQPNEMIY